MGGRVGLILCLGGGWGDGVGTGREPGGGGSLFEWIEVRRAKKVGYMEWGLWPWAREEIGGR